jgi:hypothetical protein
MLLAQGRHRHLAECPICAVCGIRQSNVVELRLAIPPPVGGYADRVLWNFSEEAARHKRLHIFEVRLRFREPGLILFRRAALCVLAQLHTAQSKLAMASIDGDEHLVIQHRSVPAHL